MSKRLLGVSLRSVMLFGLLLSFSTTALASEMTSVGTGQVPVTVTAEPAAFSVTVPSTLAVNVSATGEVTTASTVKIINHSHGAVKVTNVGVTGTEGWVTVDYDTAQMHKEKVGSKKVALTLNGSKTTGADTFKFESANFPKLDGANATDSDELVVSYSAKVPAQATSLSGQSVVNVVFTIGWDE